MIGSPPPADQTLHWSVDPEGVMRMAIQSVNAPAAPGFDDKDPYPFYYQLADGFGWQTYRDVFSTYNQEQATDPAGLPQSNVEKKNEWLARWSELSGYDMVDYMVAAWGLEVDAAAIGAVTSMALPTWMPPAIPKNDVVDFLPETPVTFNVVANDLTLLRNAAVASFT